MANYVQKLCTQYGHLLPANFDEQITMYYEGFCSQHGMVGDLVQCAIVHVISLMSMHYTLDLPFLAKHIGVCQDTLRAMCLLVANKLLVKNTILESITLANLFSNANSVVDIVVADKVVCVCKRTGDSRDVDCAMSRSAAIELMTLSAINMQLPGHKHLPVLLGAHIGESTALYMPLLPISFADTFIGEDLPVNFVLEKVHDLCCTVRDLHAIQIAHRDIKNENIRMQSDGTLVLTDFDGCALKCTGDRVSLPVYTITTRPPEILLELVPYDAFAADVWAVGCVIGAMLTGKYIFSGNNKQEAITAIEQFFRGVLATLVTSETYRIAAYPNSRPIDQLMLDMLQPNPALRPTMATVVDRLSGL
jgi:serine/threonine protein kinase